MDVQKSATVGFMDILSKGDGNNSTHATVYPFWVYVFPLLSPDL